MSQERGEDLLGHQDPAVTTNLDQVLAGVTVRRTEIGPQNLINFSILIRNFTQVKASRFPVYDACTATENTAHNCFRLAPRKAEHRDCSLADRPRARSNCAFQALLLKKPTNLSADPSNTTLHDGLPAPY